MSDLAARARYFLYLLLIVSLSSGCNLSSFVKPLQTQTQPTLSAAPVTSTLPTTPAVMSDGTRAAPVVYPGAPPAIDLPNVTLDVELFYAERWMRVQQIIDVPNGSPDAWSEVVFSIPINYTPGTFILDTLKVTLNDAIQDGLPSLFGQETMLHVPLPRPAQPGETVHIEMRYRVVFPPVYPTDWPPIGTLHWCLIQMAKAGTPGVITRLAIQLFIRSRPSR
jgi:hypothetical protein